MIKIRILLILLAAGVLFSCSQNVKLEKEVSVEKEKSYNDTPFIQESHDGYFISENNADNEIRSIAVDKESNVWVATASGIFVKEEVTREWTPIIKGNDRGPAYSVVVTNNGSVVMGTWNGIYRFQNNQLKKEVGAKPPISEITTKGDETYALGPYGIWKANDGIWEVQNYKIARSVRDAEADGVGGLFVATDAGLYFCKNEETTLYQNTDELISCYVKGVTFGPNNEVWAGVMGGVSIRENGKLVQNLTPKEGIPSNFVNCITQSPEGAMWQLCKAFHNCHYAKKTFMQSNIYTCQLISNI